MKLKWRKSGGTSIRTDTFGQTSGTTNWVRRTSPTFTAPSTAAKVELSLVTQKGTGTASFDAVRVEQVQ